ncbi:MAG TPA: hypothetical protein VMW65_13880 [Chloroflexota bacterium]|nr:hypothetical protein [Chloroflexota bacterium]
MNLTPHRSLVVDDTTEVTQAPPVRWAIGELRDALAARGAATEVVRAIEAAAPTSPVIVVAGENAAVARRLVESSGATLPEAADALALIPGRLGNRPVILATGRDERGLVYAVLELADRVRHAADPATALVLATPIVEQPANEIRGVTRLFVSDVEDKAWFYDRDFWRAYLSMLIGQRFNRFSLSLGIGHDFLRNVIDAYFLFPYPFLIDVPGYDVRAVGLPTEERDRNLATLQFIGEEAKARGLHFQLGLWTHGYAWVDSPRPNYVIEGINPENHAVYCRDALRTLLIQCPTIDGLTLRVHGESGVPEGSYDFWRTVFQGAVDCGRSVELDLHPKGVDAEMIVVALETGLPVRISPKYTAEHMGLPYQQASIRELERVASAPEGDAFVAQLMNRSAGSHRYTRYGYADFLREDRTYGVFFRIWPGTQRLLLWGDPALAAGFGRFAHFSGCQGFELCEPLSFKGRRGSGLPGGRDAYLDPSLRPSGGDWQKYLYTYRLFGRLTYNPDSDPDCWRRFLVQEFGEAAAPVETALASASRVLPLITSAHHASAANNRFWPEIYTNMPIVNPDRPHPYGDTPKPKRFGTVSALDPELFSRIDDFADELIAGQLSGKHSPVQVAAWLDALADSATRALGEADERIANPADPAYRRLTIDVRIQIGLARFFANKLRAGVAYALGTRVGSSERLWEAVQAYRSARASWVEIVGETVGVYRDDITVGGEPWLRGHWADRLAAIDDDLRDLEAELEKLKASATIANPTRSFALDRAIEQLCFAPPSLIYGHEPPRAFQPGEPLAIALTIQPTDGPSEEIQVTVRYRHVNQAEIYEQLSMERVGTSYRAVIPGQYTDAAYPLQYFFVLGTPGGQAWQYPGFAPDLANQPYFVVQKGRPPR